VRENRLHGSEGGEGESPFRPLSSEIIQSFAFLLHYYREAYCMIASYPLCGY